MREKLSARGLMLIEELVGCEILEVLKVYNHFNRIERAFYKCIPFLKKLYNGYEFLIINSVVIFYLYIILREEYNRIKDAIFIILGENIC
jgi:uncharacterized membrane protein